MGLLTCLRIKFSQALSQVLESASWERQSMKRLCSWVTLNVNWVYDTRIDHNICLQCVYFRLFSLCCHKNSPHLIILPSHYVSIQRSMHLRHLSYHDTRCSVPSRCQPVSCFISQRVTTFPPRDVLRICDLQDFACALGADDNRSDTNPPDIITISVDYTSCKLILCPTDILF